jgi:hypothetical protein
MTWWHMALADCRLLRYGYLSCYTWPSQHQSIQIYYTEVPHILISEINSHIILLHRPRSCRLSGVRFADLPTKVSRPKHSSFPLCMLHIPSISFGHHYDILRWVLTINLYNMKFSRSSCYTQIRCCYFKPLSHITLVVFRSVMLGYMFRPNWSSSGSVRIMSLSHCTYLM